MLFFGCSASKYPCCPQSRASLVAQAVTNPPAVRETRVRSLGQEDPLEERMATHSSVLAWRVPWTQELAGYSPRGCKESVTTERHTHTVYCKSNISFHLDSAAGGGGPPSHTHAHTRNSTAVESVLRPLLWVCNDVHTSKRPPGRHGSCILSRQWSWHDLAFLLCYLEDLISFTSLMGKMSSQYKHYSSNHRSQPLVK